MKKRLCILCCCLTSISSLYTQNLTGTWYMPNRSGLVEITISKDSIISRKLYPDFTPKPQPPLAEAYISIMPLKDRILMVMKSQKDSSKFSAATYMFKGPFLQEVWNGLDTTADNIKALAALHRADTRRPLFGFNWYSKSCITDTLMKMKSIDSMSKQEFMIFFKLHISKLKKVEKEFEKQPSSFMGGFSLNFQLMTQALYELGFNPVQNSQSIEVIDKFYRDPEVKEMINQLSAKKTKN